MNDFAFGNWLIHCLVGASVLMLVTLAGMWRIRQPANRQRLGEVGVLASLVLCLLCQAVPAFLIIDWGMPAPKSPEPEAVVPAPADPDPIAYLFSADSADEPAASEPRPEKAPFSRPVDAEAEVGAPALAQVLPWIFAAYGLGACFFLTRWLIGLLALKRLVRHACPAPAALRAPLTAACGGSPRLPRLLLSNRVQVPISFGLLRPTIVLPAALASSAHGEPDPEVDAHLTWILTHELTHLERGDAWSNVLFLLGQALFFPLPWYWWLRRQVRLCQEFVADAQASQIGNAEDYAEFLLSLQTSPAASALVSAASSSDLTRRVTMLVQEHHRFEKRCARVQLIAAGVGLLTLAVVAAGIGAQEKKKPDAPIQIQIQGTFILGPEVGKPEEKKPAPQVLNKEQKEVVKDRLQYMLQMVQAADKGAVQIHGAGAAERLEKVLKKLQNPADQLDLKEIRKEIAEALAQLNPAAAKQTYELRFETLPLPTAPGWGGPGSSPWMPGLPGKPGLPVIPGDFHFWMMPVDKAPPELKKLIEKLQQGSDNDKKKADELAKAFTEMEKLLPKMKLKIHERSDPGGIPSHIWIMPDDKSSPEVKKMIEKLQELGKYKKPGEKERETTGELLEKARRDLEKALGKAKVDVLPAQPTSPKGLEFEIQGADWLFKPQGKGKLGVAVEPPTAVLAEQLNLPKGEGLLILTVVDDSPAAKAGLKVNDVLLKIGGKAVPNQQAAFAEILGTLKGDVDAVVLRRGKEQTVKGIKLTPPARAIISAPMTLWLQSAPKSDNALTIKTSRKDNQFTTTAEEGKSRIVVTGAVKGEELKVEKISVEQGDSKNDYDSVDAVPPAHRARVALMLQISKR